MKVVFVSNYYNHHQAFFSKAMYKNTNGQYVFVATEPMEQERVAMGWAMKSEPPFVRIQYKSEKEKNEVQKIIDDAEVVILGSAPDYLIKSRVRAGKLTFRYSERIYKKEPRFYKLFLHYLRFWYQGIHAKNVYLLCASAYTSFDFNRINAFKGRCFKWGYFPSCRNYDNLDTLLKRKRKESILWVARFIDWKHPEIPIQIVERCKKEGYDIDLKMVGNGILLEKFKECVKEKGLQNNVHFLGAMPPEEVRQRMEESEIFLFTSDKNEGWGAVLNEAMNSACAVVASHAIGAVPYLIEDGINGLIYKDGDIGDVYLKITDLLKDANKRKTLAVNAYRTITEVWNAENASKRLLQLIDALQKSSDTPFKSGPCSKAELLNDTWK